jgi:hypothetical protein
MMRREAASPIYRLAFLYKIVIADSLQRARTKAGGAAHWRLGAIETHGVGNIDRTYY